MMKWGTVFAIIPPAAFVRYAIKGRYMGRKVFFGICVTLFDSHFYWLGQHFAVARNMRQGCDSFCIDTNYELGSQMENFLIL